MKKTLLYKLVLASLFAAVIFVMTYFFPFPFGPGYVNLGDCFVILAGVVLGPAYGFASAAVGSALSDLLLGYGIYAPVTFVIKGLMALVAYFIVGKSLGRHTGITILRSAVAAVVAELIMILGYFLFEIPLYGFSTALADTLSNGIQGAVGAVAAIAVCSVLSGTGLIHKLTPPAHGKQ